MATLHRMRRRIALIDVWGLEQQLTVLHGGTHILVDKCHDNKSKQHRLFEGLLDLNSGLVPWAETPAGSSPDGSLPFLLVTLNPKP